MGNSTSSQGKFKQKNSDGSTPVQQDDPLAHIPSSSSSKIRRGSDDASSLQGGKAKSEFLTRPRFSSPKHKRNASETQVPPKKSSPPTILVEDQSDSTSDISSLHLGLDVENLSYVSEPSSATMRQSIKEKKDLAEASQVKPWLFLAGEEVAKNKEYLIELGITHILNCAHTYCQNFHEDSFEYLRPIDALDTSKEEIGNFMLQVIADIEGVREQGKKILVHCQVGSSRSATLVIGYIMWLENMNHEEAFRYVKTKRGIVQPNFGFLGELQAFEKRLRWHPTEPSLFRIAPHSRTVGSLVPKLVVSATSKDPVIPRVEHLDPRGTFLVHSPQDRTLYLWVGPDVGQQAQDEAEARTKARKEKEANGVKRSDSISQRETYEQGGRRVGKIMSKYEKAFRDVDNKPCSFVQVPTEFTAIKALDPDADHKSLAARFWFTVGESIGTRTGIDVLRQKQQSRRWSEGQAEFAFVDSDRNLLSQNSSKNEEQVSFSTVNNSLTTTTSSEENSSSLLLSRPPSTRIPDTPSSRPSSTRLPETPTRADMSPASSSKTNSFRVNSPSSISSSEESRLVKDESGRGGSLIPTRQMNTTPLSTLLDDDSKQQKMEIGIIKEEIPQDIISQNVN